MAARIYLNKGGEVPVIRGHPWVYSGAIARHEEDPAGGDEAEVLTRDGAFIGRATWHPRSEIRARVFTASRDEALDEAGVRARVRAACERRVRWLGREPEGGLRTVFSESDGLPGLIADRYGPVLVVQFLTEPWVRRREWALDALREFWKPETIWERSEAEVVRHEGLEPRAGLAWGRDLDGPVPFAEHGVRFLADVREGHKTGFYLDQRASRERAADWVRRTGARSVLDVFAYAGGFGLRARLAGAQTVVGLDSSARARDLALRLHELNGLDTGALDYRVGDAFELLRTLKGEGRTFDVAIVDPPRLAPHRHQLQRALRAYKDANMTALKLVAPGGLLLTFCCSGVVDRDLFEKVIEGAARDAGRRVYVLEHLAQPPDHPGKPGFAESEYLKGLVIGT